MWSLVLAISDDVEAVSANRSQEIYHNYEEEHYDKKIKHYIALRGQTITETVMLISHYLNISETNKFLFKDFWYL